MRYGVLNAYQLSQHLSSQCRTSAPSSGTTFLAITSWIGISTSRFSCHGHIQNITYVTCAAGVIPFPLYYALDVLKGALNPLAIVMSAVADVAEGHLRATFFSLLMVTMSIAMIIAAGVGGLLGPSMAAQVSVVGYTINLLIITFALPGAVPD